jgi:hypothetical protein
MLVFPTVGFCHSGFCHLGFCHLGFCHFGLSHDVVSGSKNVLHDWPQICLKNINFS